MKRLILLFVFLFAVQLAAQGHDQRPQERKEPTEEQKQKIDQFVKARIIEVLNLKDDVSIKLFVARNENRKIMGDLGKERENLVLNLEKDFKSGKRLSRRYLAEKLDKIDEVDRTIHEQRVKYSKSLRTILNPEQMAKYHVLVSHLSDEINKEMYKEDKNVKK